MNDDAPDETADAVDDALEAAMSVPEGEGEGVPDGDPLGPDPLEAPDDGGGWDADLIDALTRSPDKSIHQIDQSEYFDPEAGGTNRLILVADDVLTNGEGLPNWAHLLIGAVEVAIDPPERSGDDGDGESRDGDHENDETELSEMDTRDLEVA